MKRFLQILFVSGAVFAGAEEKILFAPKDMKDWVGARAGVTGSDGVFNTNNRQHVLISRQKFPVTPGKTYTLSGKFKLNLYAPFGNIHFGLMTFDANGKALRRVYCGESPVNSRVAGNNRNQVRDFQLTFSGSVPSEKFKFPEGTATVQVILHQFENNIVDMTFRDIRLTEK